MQYFYELGKDPEGLPIKVYIHRVNGVEMHWHNEMELLFVLQGSVQVRVGKERYILQEKDLILINSMEIHNVSKIQQDNMLLVLQINIPYFSVYYPDFKKMFFDCKSFLYPKEEQQKFNMVRYYLAKIVWELNKQRAGYQLIVCSDVHMLVAYLVKKFDYVFIDAKQEAVRSRDIERLQKIMQYIDENYERKITLKEIAKQHQLSFYYLSHFIKGKLGMSFQDYLNNIRLDRATSLLLNGDKTITEISHASGFASTKAFNKLFKDTYGISPTEYKRDANKMITTNKCQHLYIGRNRSKTYLDVDRQAALKKLFAHLEFLNECGQDAHGTASKQETISVNATDAGVCYQPYWKKLTTYTRASEGLRRDWQYQLQELQREIGFEYIRFHGIFSDDMMVCNLNEAGGITYNWAYVDALFDFFQAVKIKPFIELGFMPAEIKSSDETIFWWRANISQPRDIRLWTDLVAAFIKHCINRYGIKEVQTWYFEVWNEPDLEHVFWIGGKKQYFEFYKQTVMAVKSVCAELKVGGPAITHQAIIDGTWLEDFLVYCNQNSVPLDFVSIHIYPESYSAKKSVQNLMLLAKQGEDPKELIKQWRNLQRIYFDKNHTFDTLNSAHKKIKQSLTHSPELHVTEWNASAYNRNLIHDTCFVATFIISNVLKCIGKVDSLGYWTFTDINEEVKAGISAFHGGFGLINAQGLKKPSYWAYYLLSKLGKKIIAQSDEHIVTKTDQDIQILIFNYTYFDNLFSSGDTSALTNKERYLVYQAKPVKEVELNISGLTGDYKLTNYCLNREHGSVYDEWVQMGGPENMLPEELNYLRGTSHPKVTVKHLTLAGNYQTKLTIPVHGVELITLEKKI